jgi:hypothetical protein
VALQNDKGLGSRSLLPDIKIRYMWGEGFARKGMDMPVKSIT